MQPKSWIQNPEKVYLPKFSFKLLMKEDSEGSTGFSKINFPNFINPFSLYLIVKQFTKSKYNLDEKIVIVVFWFKLEKGELNNERKD